MLRIKRIASLSILIVLFLSGQAFCQTHKLYKKGIKAFYKEDFKTAASYFEQVEATGKSVKDSKYRLELSYLVQKEHRERDLTTILSFVDLKSKYYKFHHYWMGRIYANRYMFPEALNEWEIFLSQKASKSSEIIKETDAFLRYTQRMVNFFDNPNDYEIQQLDASINSPKDELSPVFSPTNDRLLFTSNRRNDEEFEVFQAKSNGKGWNTPTAITVLGTFSRRKSNIELRDANGKLFMYSDEKKGDLYFSELKNNEWTVPREFDSEVTTTKLGSQFYINEHEDRLIYSSQNKYKGLDLVESFKNIQTGEWEKPQRFLPIANSSHDEISPYLSPDEMHFYFASDKEGGIGGFDIYESVFDPVSRTWSEPENMGWPINSPDDELSFKLNPDGQSGYFTSNRIRSLGGQDIYHFWKVKKTKIQGKVLYADNGEAVTGGEIRFLPTQYLDEYFRSSIDEKGNYATEIIANETFQLRVMEEMDTLHKEIFQVEEIDGESVTHVKNFYISRKANILDSPVESAQMTASIDTKPIPTNTKKERVEAKKPQVQPKSKTTLSRKSSRLVNIYFDYGTSTLKDESEPKLKELYDYLAENGTINIEIAGHTDNVSSEQTNQLISQNRAEAVKKWLTSHGIDNSRISTVGYGESRPIASNDDEIDGRALNRRIEVRIVDYSDNKLMVVD